jgi:hypothetical protein
MEDNAPSAATCVPCLISACLPQSGIAATDLALVFNALDYCDFSMSDPHLQDFIVAKYTTAMAV